MLRRMNTYCTEIIGTFEISPGLNRDESEYLIAFSETRRWWRSAGPYVVLPHPKLPEPFDDPALYETPHPGEPDLCCGWIPAPGGHELAFNGSSEFGRPGMWLRYLINHFLRSDAKASRSGDPAFSRFTFNHTVSGVAAARSPGNGRLWLIQATDNVVREQVLVPGERMLGEEDDWKESMTFG